MRARLKKHINKKSAVSADLFFKTGPGEYSAHDQFLGVSVPNLRLVAKEFATASLSETLKLLHSPFNEERQLALFILTGQFRKGNSSEQKKIYQLLLKNRKWVNNWNLVDSCAHWIIGAYLLNRDRSILTKLARSKNLWDRRLAVVSTFAFIRANDLAETFRLSKMLMNDEEDLMHKACGWMLREAGKRDSVRLEKFILENVSKMPRTMLRYSIEKMPDRRRKEILSL